MDEGLNFGKFSSGSKTYFFDLKYAQNGDLYLRLSSVKESAEIKAQRNHLFVFEEDFDEFERCVLQLLSQAKKMRNLEIGDSEGLTLMEAIKKVHKQAYQPWEKTDDERLELYYSQGKSIRELTLIFERKEGAIRSRIKKLGLNAK